MKQRVVWLLCFLSIGISGCNQGQSSVTETISIGASFPLGRDPDLLDRTYTFFAGNPVETFSLTVNVEGVTEGVEITALLSDDQEITTITGNGVTTIEYPGNWGRLRFRSEELTIPPRVNIVSLTRVMPSGVFFPEVPSDPGAPRVSSMPLPLGNPLDLFFPADGEARYFVSVAGVAGKMLEVVWDGPGSPAASPFTTSTVFIGSDSDNGFPLSEETADSVLTPASRGLARFTVGSQRDVLFLTVSNPENGDPGWGRLSVREVDEDGEMKVDVNLRFWGPVAMVGAEALDASLRSALTMANTELYRVTQGRVTLGNVTLNTGLISGNPLLDDIFILPPVDSSSLVAPLPDGKLGFVMADPPAPATSGATLAHYIMSVKLGLPDERGTINETDLCPNSAMSVIGGLRLCWAGNHNPFDSNELGNLSAWERLASQLGTEPPGSQPVGFLRNSSFVQPPFNMVIN